VFDLYLYLYLIRKAHKYVRKQESRDIRKVTARCALYMSASHVSSQSRTRVKLNSVFPTAPLNSPEFPHVPLGVGGYGLWATKSEGVALITNLCHPDPPTSQTDRQTDGQTTCSRKTALCTIVHRAEINVTEIAGTTRQKTALSVAQGAHVSIYIYHLYRMIYKKNKFHSF